MFILLAIGFLGGCSTSPEDAKIELASMNVSYANPSDSLLTIAINKDELTGKKQVRAAELLLILGADVNYLEHNQTRFYYLAKDEVPLHAAVAHAKNKDYSLIINFLLSSGASPNLLGSSHPDSFTLDIYTWTPLSQVSFIRNESLDVVKLLLEAGADPDLKFAFSPGEIHSIREYWEDKKSDYIGMNKIDWADRIDLAIALLE